MADGRSRNGLPRRPARPAARVGRPARTARRTGAGHSRRQRLRPRRYLRHRGDRWSAHGASRPSAAERRRPPAPVPAGRRRAARRLLRHGPDGPGLRGGPGSAAPRRQPRTAGHGVLQPGSRARARLPGQQQCEPYRHRPFGRRTHTGILARRRRRCGAGAAPGRSAAGAHPGRGPGSHRRVRGDPTRGHLRVPTPRRIPPTRAAARSAVPRERWSSACCTGSWSPSRCPSRNSSCAWPARTTPSRGSCPDSPACTTWTTIRRPTPFRD